MRLISKFSLLQMLILIKALYNVEYASTMASFYRKVNSNQATVGWLVKISKYLCIHTLLCLGIQLAPI